MRQSTIYPDQRLVCTSICAVSLILCAGVLSARGAPQANAATTLCEAIPSAILSRSVAVCVVLPSGYDLSKSRYPTLYFLHGLFENERSWSERGGQQVLEGLRAKGEVGDFLVVLPNGGKTFYVNSYDGRERYEDFIVQELVPLIDRKYRTIPSAQMRGISGTSMGGYGALHLGMDHPEVFGSVSAHSAALLPKIPRPLPSTGRWGFYAGILQTSFGSPLNDAYWNQNNPLNLAEHPERFAQLKLYFDCGDQDRYGFEDGAQALHQKLRLKGFPHEFAIRPGDHGWSYLSQYLKYSLHFHWRLFAGAEGGAASTATAGGQR
jgi:S-formylglutathione hydrolase FrmB